MTLTQNFGKNQDNLWFNTEIFVCQVDKGTIVLVKFSSAHKLESSEKRNLNWKDVSVRLSCK